MSNAFGKMKVHISWTAWGWLGEAKWTCGGSALIKGVVKGLFPLL